ncbi:MAG: hypothetical protein WD449_01870 [Candidatus Babeliales bacterium]
MLKNRRTRWIVYSIMAVSWTLCVDALPQYYATVSDTQHYEWLINLIGSIHKTNIPNLAEIAVYDIGLTVQERSKLARMKKVVVYPIEKVNPDLCTQFQSRTYGKWVRGWYAWKPVAIKQALEKFPYILYLDAGSSVVKSLDHLFEYIKERGYFLISNNHTLRDWTTRFVIDQFQLNSSDRAWILDALCMTAGVQGLSQIMMDSYIKPLYELAKDMRYFQDDGTARNGFGQARHDQCIFTIQARLLNLTLFDELRYKGGIIPLMINGRHVPFYTTWDKSWQDGKTELVIQSKGRLHYDQYIIYI